MKSETFVKDYAKLSESNLDKKAQEVISKLTDNPHFPVTSPTLAEFTAFQETYSIDLINASSGDKAAIGRKNESKQALCKAMRELATDLESTAKNNRSKMLTAGFDLAVMEDTVPSLATPVQFMLKEGINPGEVISVVKSVPQAITYSHEYTGDNPTKDTVWITKVVSTAKYTHTGLPSGARIWGRVAAIGRKEQIAYSAVVSRMVQ